MKLLKLKSGCYFLGFGVLVLCVSGCFQATNKFYLNSDVITDNRFEGSFGDEATNQNSSARVSVTIKAGSNKHYIATYQEKDHWIKLDAVLFKCGTNIFVDISHLDDNGAPHEPAVGPSGLDLLLLATREKAHSAIRVRFFDGGVEFDSGIGNPIIGAIRKESGLKTKTDENGTIFLTDSTEKIRSFLEKVGSDDSIFNQKSRLIKNGK